MLSLGVTNSQAGAGVQREGNAAIRGALWASLGAASGNKSPRQGRKQPQAHDSPNCRTASDRAQGSQGWGWGGGKQGLCMARAALRSCTQK